MWWKRRGELRGGSWELGVGSRGQKVGGESSKASMEVRASDKRATRWANPRSKEAAVRVCRVRV